MSVQKGKTDVVFSGEIVRDMAGGLAGVVLGGFGRQFFCLMWCIWMKMHDAMRNKNCVEVEIFF